MGNKGLGPIPHSQIPIGNKYIEDYNLKEKEKVKIERIMNIVKEIIKEGIFKGIWDNSQSGEDI